MFLCVLNVKNLSCFRILNSFHTSLRCEGLELRDVLLYAVFLM
jgi:hypothetical protein